jgi:cation:H+ antiporter
MVLVLIANHFADSLLASGTSLGMDPYVLIQSVVPAATEAPEFIAVAILVVNRRPAHGLALFLASSLSELTLALGALPTAYLAGGGGPALPLAGREQLELGFTVVVALFVVAALAAPQPEPADSYLLLSLFAVQLVWPSTFVRLMVALVLLIFAVDILVSRRRAIAPLLRAGFRRHHA